MTGKRIEFATTDDRTTRSGVAGQYAFRGGAGYVHIKLSDGKEQFFACETLLIHEATDTAQPVPVVAEAPKPPAEPEIPGLPPEAPPVVPPAGAPPKDAVHARLRAANAANKRGIDHGANAATEDDFVQGVAEERKPKA